MWMVVRLSSWSLRTVLGGGLGLVAILSLTGLLTGETGCPSLTTIGRRMRMRSHTSGEGSGCSGGWVASGCGGTGTTGSRLAPWGVSDCWGVPIATGDGAPEAGLGSVGMAVVGLGGGLVSDSVSGVLNIITSAGIVSSWIAPHLTVLWGLSLGVPPLRKAPLTLPRFY